MLDGVLEGFVKADAKAVLKACGEALGGLRPEFSIDGVKVILSPALGGRGPFKGVLIVDPDRANVQAGVRSLTPDGVHQAILGILVDLVHGL